MPDLSWTNFVWRGSLLSVRERVALEGAPKLNRQGGDSGLKPAGVRALAGDVWNLPNNVIGLAYGGLGTLAGEIGHAVAPSRVRKPDIRYGAGKVEFVNNPLAAAGAITIGDNIVYGDDPYSAEGAGGWAYTDEQEGHPVG